MSLMDLNINLIKQLLTQQIEQVICSACYKCYSAPVTAQCGYTLCNACWCGRTRCPQCKSPVERTVLKLNLPLQRITDHLHAVIQSFEKLFEIKLAELELPTSINVNETGTNKNVTDWLENSQNKFSAPISNMSSQDLNPEVEYISSIAQIHTTNAKPTHQDRKRPIQPSQHDWDKIEIIEEGDYDKNQENVELPMDIETLDVEDNEYTSEKPHMSTRQKKISTNREPREIQNEKTDSTKSNTTVSEHPTKMKQTWNHAKKMRLEFRELNKKNVSIETAEKQVLCGENKLEKQNLTTNIARNITPNVSSKETEEEKCSGIQNIVDPDEISDHSSKKSIAKTNECTSTNQTSSDNPNKNNTSIDSRNPGDNEDAMSPKVKFLKKAPLHVKAIESPCICNIPDQTKQSDDIIITIKVGKVTTNICIKQEESNPQVKIQTDKEIQTSLTPVNNNINIGLSKNITNNLNIVQSEAEQLNSNHSNRQPNPVLLNTNLSHSNKEIMTKSDSIKKNTASADTRTMELIEEIYKTRSQKENNDQQSQGTQKENMPSLEGIHDLFDCGEFSKTPSVQSLKASKNVPSAILVSTQNQSKTYTPVDKRLRSLDSDELPLKKKQRLNTVNLKTQVEKVFDNIDADIEITQTNKAPESYHKPLSHKANSNKNTQVYSQNHHKESENLFSNCDSDMITQSNKLNTQTKANKKEILKPDLCRELTSQEEIRENENMDIEIGTPLNNDSDVSIVEETPQKDVSNIKVKPKSGISSNFDNNNELSSSNNHNPKNISTISNNLNKTLKNKQENTDIKNVNNPIITPSTINKFVEQIQHKSTPVARKSLNFNMKNVKQDTEEILCKSSLTEVETTQEKEFMNEVFQARSNVVAEKNRKVEFCVAGSCLLLEQTSKVRQVCRDRGWRFVDKYTSDVTHLVIDVDEENKCKRSLKYMRALAAGKWIVGYAWLEKCIQTGTTVPEESFECVDMTGEPGPRRSRLAQRKLFTGIAFYCMSPISMLHENMLKEILESAGGRLVNKAREVRVTDRPPGLVLAEPDDTQDDKFHYLAIDEGIVPVHCEWALNCLGQYALAPLEPSLLLCSPTLLKPKLQHWPHELRALIE